VRRCSSTTLFSSATVWGQDHCRPGPTLPLTESPSCPPDLFHLVELRVELLLGLLQLGLLLLHPEDELLAHLLLPLLQ
jgi:hypothetical protein